MRQNPILIAVLPRRETHNLCIAANNPQSGSDTYLPRLSQIKLGTPYPWRAPGCY